VVGSLLRPPEIHDAREKLAAGEIDAGELRAIEDGFAPARWNRSAAR
jgi:methionine synthase II (cobalamin-independent)